MGTLRYLALVALLAVTACAGPRTAAGPSEEYVEIDNPAYTMSPTASPTIWVPRRYVESGVPRGGELLKKGYEAATRGAGEEPSPPKGEESHLYARYYRVVSVGNEGVCFNVDRSASVKPGGKLRLSRGGSVVEGIGFVPGAVVGTVTITGPGGPGKVCGTLEQGGEARVNDLVRVE